MENSAFMIGVLDPESPSKVGHIEINEMFSSSCQEKKCCGRGVWSHLSLCSSTGLFTIAQRISKGTSSRSIFRDMDRAFPQMNIMDYLEQEKDLDHIDCHLVDKITACANTSAPSYSLFSTINSLTETLEEYAMSLGSKNDQIYNVYQVLRSQCLINSSAEKYFISRYVEKDANIPHFLGKTWYKRYKALKVFRDRDG
ncbi:hypothetical protein DFH28DRAFT_931868 [Melampsora americana]|nr:hypothetical protein DFH28DRAFT_931868 [Melampsora americana]